MVHFRDRVRHSCYTFVYHPPSDDTGTIDRPVLTQPKLEEDRSPQKVNVALTANSGGSHRPGGSRFFSSRVSDDSLPVRTRDTNLRKDPNHRNRPSVTSSSASWPLQGEKSSDSSRSPTVEFFNLLSHRPITRKELRWDLVKPLSMSRINNWLNCVSFLDGPALGSNVFSAQIHFRESHLWRLEHLWGPITVHTNSPDQPISLRRLFDEIFNYFQCPVKDTDSIAEAVAMRGEDIVDSWRQRNYNTYQPRSPYMHDPFIRRVDFLLGFSLFRKLRFVSVSGQSCHLVLSIR